jgi:hypothetical protein
MVRFTEMFPILASMKVKLFATSFIPPIA